MEIEKGGKYYVTRNHSSILAFKVGNQLDEYSFHVTASHSDSPTFKIKENAEIEVKEKIHGSEYRRLWRNDLFYLV